MATSEFGKAFRAAREAGDKEFEFGGKKYNTKMKDEDSAPAKKAEPKASQEFPKTPAPKYDASSESKPEKKGGIGPYNAFSGVGDYLNKTFTMEGREQAKKEGKEKYGMKKGGAVSASRRADGIAQRGKTRGKMC